MCKFLAFYLFHKYYCLDLSYDMSKLKDVEQLFQNFTMKLKIKKNMQERQYLIK